MRYLLRALGTSALVAALAVGASADTIYLKNGSVIRGSVVGYANGEFTVLLEGVSRSRATLAEVDIDRIEFDGDGGRVDPSNAPSQQRRSDPGSMASRRNDTAAPVSDPYSSGAPASAAAREGDVVVRPEADWTNTNFRVQRGSRVTITATGSYKLDATGRRTAGPDGLNVPDRDKLMPARPTGGLIAVVGDDNDEFVYVGSQAQFVAERDGYLFLSVNEGNLRDNSGQIRAHVVVEPPGAAAPRQTAGMSGRRSPAPSASRRDPAPRPSAPPATSRRDPAPSPSTSDPGDSTYPDPSDPGGYDPGDSDPVDDPGAYDSGSTSEPPSAPPASTRRNDPTPSAPPATSGAPAGAIPAGTVVRETQVTVQPTLDWTNTKLRVDRGQIVRVSASGSVRLDSGGRRVAGPGGIEAPDADKLIPGRPTGALVAVIGDDNDEFIYVGTQSEWVAQRSGVLFLSVNEGNLRDNSGSFTARVRIEQPRVAAPGATTGSARQGGAASQPAQRGGQQGGASPAGTLPTPVVGDATQGGAQAPAPRPAAPQIGPSGGQADLVIPARGDWTSTQIVVKKGQRIRISASGTVKLDATGPTVSPAGTNKADPHKLIADRPTGALVAVIGDDNNDYIFVGDQAEFVAARDGLLFIGINEGELADNSGTFAVRVVVGPARP